MPKVTADQSHPNFSDLETSVLDFWQKTDAFKKSIHNRDLQKSYVFYDGPPFATGMPHYGHLLASTVKDVIPRYWTMKGYRVNRVWGWDCHGLPIEHMIEKELDIKGGKIGIEKLGIANFNDACRSEVLRLDSEWEKIINRLGRWVDFKNNYKTMDFSFMESVWWGFKHLYDKGLIYQGKKVILYCPRCATPLSNFEIAMDNSYVDVTEPSNVYKYKIINAADTYILAWSTTPWNKIATPALAVNPQLQYVKVSQELKSGKTEYYYLAQNRLSILDENQGKISIMESISGAELAKIHTFELHYDFYPNRNQDEKAGIIIADDFVTAVDGTGVVTLAVYGEEDYRVMQANQVQLVEHIDEQGKLKPEVTPWAGMFIEKVNPLVNQDLVARGLMYREFSHQHNVATCYRCNTRLYYAPIPAWFINVKKLKSDLIELNQSINWFPSHLKNGRFGKGLENAPDWNISRSRYWGTPMPIWVGQSKNGAEITRVIGSLQELREWAVDSKAAQQVRDLHRHHLDGLELWVDDNKTVKGKRIPEVFDCWVESGSMPFASIHYPFENKELFEKNYPAQFVSEYIAQTRAWFYTMHVISTGIFKQPPFENVLTTGTILAEDGNKMSKSKKNFPDPLKIIETYGVDSLRLYLMSSPVMKGESLNFNEKEVSDIRRKVFIIWWNILIFYLSFADTSQPITKPIATPNSVLDTWLLSRVQTITHQITTYLDEYDVVRSSRVAMDFVEELSTWYLRLSRDRIRDQNHPDHSQVSSIFGYAIYRLAQLMAPFAVFFSELIHHTLINENTSIHHTDWPNFEDNLYNPSLEKAMNVVKQVVEIIRAQRTQQNLKLRQPLGLATIKISAEFASLLNQDLLDLIAQESNLKKVVVNTVPQNLINKTKTTPPNSLSQESVKDTEPIQVEIDTNLTPELKAEGQAREIMRQIQVLRRKASLKVGEKVTVSIPDWPQAWQQEIELKTNTVLTKGSTTIILN
jgi:isoleucyl-tRNA synthetase